MDRFEFEQQAALAILRSNGKAHPDYIVPIVKLLGERMEERRPVPAVQRNQSDAMLPPFAFGCPI